MRVRLLHMEGFRSFRDPQSMSFNNINVIVGHNNAGKSSVIRALHLLQVGLPLPNPDVRSDVEHAYISISLDNVKTSPNLRIDPNTSSCRISFEIQAAGRITKSVAESISPGKEFEPFPNVAPGHVIIPFLSKRKTTQYSEDIKDEHAKRINNDISNLAAKLSIVGNRSYSKHELYYNACVDIIGFPVTAIPSAHGQRPGTYLPPNNEVLSIDQMGEGVSQIASLLADLAMAEDKIFLIEEPENDLHPTALKSLLELIIKSSERNQFVITTHSNIVVRHLCAEESSRLFEVRTESRNLPITSSIEEVKKSPEARIAVLKDLGYTLSDFDLWEGWLILEESSAERIIRDFLIPWFTPKLSSIRTLSTNGNKNIEPAFKDFHRLFLYSHLENVYLNKAWVYIDGDIDGKSIVAKLREKFSDWKSDHFDYFEKSQFEFYFPNDFATEIQRTLDIADSQKKRDEKKNLLNKVIEWLRADEERGKLALQTSAEEIIQKLKKIEGELFPTKIAK
ncbi:MAG: AAA family ATPase [Pseudomonadota bacterium]